MLETNVIVTDKSTFPPSRIHQKLEAPPPGAHPTANKPNCKFGIPSSRATPHANAN